MSKIKSKQRKQNSDFKKCSKLDEFVKKLKEIHTERDRKLCEISQICMEKIDER